MCVSQKHRVVIVSSCANQLCVYSIDDGSLARKIGTCGKAEKGQCSYYGGVCVSPDGDTVLVAGAISQSCAGSSDRWGRRYISMYPAHW